ncbi:MAG: hypothetical protein DCF15_15290 [Phormidesmis priestleyi]|uniref:TNase-like domain-containing protein n=1 Tax=Phormidesmis priestleyi TaxID=268141 RepID=A0A2W4X937_9CYAN|nr:MAG: hypothetical protein DCF15_15290 [Phormidesmis priestleyi]
MSLFYLRALRAISLLAVCAFPFSVQAHSGRTNAEGCHNDHSNGTYHCHGGSSSSGTAGSSSPGVGRSTNSTQPSSPSSSSNSSNSSGGSLNAPGNVIELPGLSNRNSNPGGRAEDTQSAPVTPSSESWRVLSVGDGDTLRVSRGEDIQTIRLACIDAPEMRQPTYGELAKQQLQALLPVNTVVSLRPVDTDRYGRLVAEVFRPNGSVNLSLIASGHAVVYRQYLSSCNAETYLNAEAIAQQNGLLFWSQANPVMPWDFRRQ